MKTCKHLCKHSELVLFYIYQKNKCKMKHTLYGQYVFLQVLLLSTECNVALALDGTSTERERWIPGRV